MERGVESAKGRVSPEVSAAWTIFDNISSAVSVARLMETSLGPRGMYKIISGMGETESERLMFTNDGARMLRAIYIESPVARLIREVAETLHECVGDGVKTAIVLAGALLERAMSLISRGVKVATIIRGYSEALDVAARALRELASSPPSREVLEGIASTSIMGKSVELWGCEGHLARMVVDAALAATEEVGGVKRVRVENIKVEAYDSGLITESELVRGVVTKPAYPQEEHNPVIPRRAEKVKVALIHAPIEVDKPSTLYHQMAYDAEQLTAYRQAELEDLHRLIDRLKSLGAKVILCGRRVDRLPQFLLGKEGIMVVRNIPGSDMERLAEATGGRIVQQVTDLSPDDLGWSELVEWRKLTAEGEWVLFVRGREEGRASTILLRGCSIHVKDAVDDAIRAVSAAIEDGRYVGGGGAVEVELAEKLREYAREVRGVESLVFEAFAESLEAIPRALASNAGMKWHTVGPKVKAMHAKGMVNAGLNVLTGEVVDDVLEENIVEPFKVKMLALVSAVEAATTILKIDKVIYAKAARERAKEALGEGP